MHETGANMVHEIPAGTDPDLAFIVSHWHDLPDTTKASILDIVRCYSRTPDAGARRRAVQQALRKAHDAGAGPRGDRPL